MGSITDSFVNSYNAVINGQLSRKRLEAQDEELKLLRLQRADYEGSKLYRDHKRQLELQTDETKLGYEQKQNQIAELNRVLLDFQVGEAKDSKGLAKRDKEASIAASESVTGYNRQATQFALEDRGHAKEMQKETLSKAQKDNQAADSNLIAAQLGQTNAQVQLAKDIGGSIEPGAQDVMSMVEQLYAGQKDPGPTAKATMFQVLSGAQENKRREIDDHRRFIQDREKESQLLQASRQAETVQYIAAQGEAGVAAAKTFLGEDNPTYKAAAELVARGGLPTDRSNVDPLVLEEGKALVKQIADINEQIRLKKQDVQRAKADIYGVLTSRRKAEQRPVDELADLEAQKYELTGRRDEIAKANKSKGSAPLVSIDEVGKRISANDSDDRLKTIADAYNLDLAELKRIRNAKKGK